MGVGHGAIRLAADFDRRFVALVLRSPGNGPDGFPPWSLTDSPQLRREVTTALADREVSASLGDGFVIYPDKDVDSLLPALDVHAELGTARIATVSFDPDLERTIDQIARLAEETAQRGMETVLEPVPALPVNSLTLAQDIVKRIRNPKLRLLIDSMHMGRSSVTGESLRAVPAEQLPWYCFRRRPRP